MLGNNTSTGNYGLFDAKTALRLEKMLIWWEHSKKSNGIGEHYNPIARPQMFWAKITAFDSDMCAYSWEQVIGQVSSTIDPPTNPVMDVQTDPQLQVGLTTNDNGFAYEVMGSANVEIGSIQYMMPAIGQNFMVFKDSGSGSGIIPAKILGKSVGEGSYGYSWVKLIGQADGTFLPSDDPNDTHLYTDNDYAVDSGSSQWVLTNEYVDLTKVEGQQYYEFNYSPGVAYTTAPSGGIPANSSATCLVYGVDNILVYNQFSTAVPTNATIYISYSSHHTRWFVTEWDCSSGGY